MKRMKLRFGVKRAILACGADMKGAFALARGNIAYLFDGFGDLADLDNFTRYEKAVKDAVKRLKIIPKIIAHDLHPGYFSTQFAKDYTMYDVRCTMYGIQHHEAHIASAIVDNSISGEMLGVAFDGTGYGTDGCIWGGEFFVGGAKHFKRVAHLDYIPMPGGDMAIKEPWRMAASYLYKAFGQTPFAIVKKMIDKSINSPLTSSAGRLFDAAGSLILNKYEAKFEAELPIELERIADADIDEYYDFEDTAKIIKGIVKDLDKRIAPSIISAKFHNSIALMILKMAKKMKMKKIVLSGGVFQNKYLTTKTVSFLEEHGFKVFTHLNVSTNDSGIPIGQIAIAAARHICA